MNIKTLKNMENKIENKISILYEKEVKYTEEYQNWITTKEYAIENKIAYSDISKEVKKWENKMITVVNKIYGLNKQLSEINKKICQL